MNNPINYYIINVFLKSRPTRDELDEEDDDEDDPDDESSLSACAVGMASAAPTPRKTASAPTRPMNFPGPAAPLDLPGRPSASKFGERITTPQDVS